MRPSWVGPGALWIFFLVGILYLGLVGLGTGLRRMCAFAGLGSVLGVAGQLTGWQTDMPTLALDGIALVFGAAVFVRFLRSHPAQTGDVVAADGGTNHAA